jgi:hypothetical protein
MILEKIDNKINNGIIIILESNLRLNICLYLIYS